MIRSMTGFGKANREYKGKQITVELRSLNSKNADISLRVSSSLRDYELDIRSELSRSLERGKIDLSIYIENTVPETPAEINIPLAKVYFDQLRALSLELGQPMDGAMQQVLSFPEVIRTAREESSEEEVNVVRECIRDAVVQLNKFREAEGKALMADFRERIEKIDKYLSEVAELDKARLKNIRDRIRNNIREIAPNGQIDENRFEQELIYYIEKLDINEEKVRLKTHLNYFLETCNETSPGRKLAFISQEIGREINTIGAKANDAQIQRRVVLMKDELEKIKEQSNNVL